MTRPPDLEGLPWPEGEPGPLRSASTRLRGLAGGFDGAAGRLPAAVPAAWTGVAASSYSGSMGQATTAVGHLSGSLDDAAGALSHLAHVIEEAQETVRRAAAKLHDARQKAARAQRAADDAQAEADRAQQAVTLSPSAVLPGDPLAQQADAARLRASQAATHADNLRGDAESCARWAHGQADHAVGRVRAADQSCAGRLELTGFIPMAPMGPYPPATPGQAKALWDFVYDVGVKPLNPWDPGYTKGESNTVWGGYASGVLFGTGEWTSHYASENWMRREPGYWSREPRWVEPYTRRTPSGGTTRVSGYMRRGVWAESREVPDLVARAKWATRARWFGRAGGAASFVTAGLGQYFADAGNPNLDGAERTGRIGAQMATVGTAGALGGWGGAAAGAAIGTAICPGVGTVIGGVVGGIIGGGVAGGLVDHFNDSVVNKAGDIADDVWDSTKDTFDDVKSTVSDGLDKAGDVIDDLTPW